jgi:UDP-4-amino-4-deoxy-L-arabinose-oxoglutarate aminotransferase
MSERRERPSYGEPIIFGQPQIGPEEIDLVTRTLESSWIGQGPLVAEFERRLAAAVWAEHAVAVSSCTAALELSLLALGVGPGDEVITSPLTFVATVNAIEAVGATPVLVDIDGDTLVLTPDAVAAHATDRTRAVMPVSFGGRPLDLDGFVALAADRDLFVVEDAAHAIGAVAAGQPVGATRNRRLLTCFSFYPNKNLASAEGGAITVLDADIAFQLQSLRLHGLNADAWDRYRDRRFRPTLAIAEGRKANWTDVQAAIALPQLAKLEGFQAAREWLAECYDEQLTDTRGIRLVRRPAHGLRERHALHLYQVRVDADQRDRIVSELRDQGIGAAVHYPAVHHHPHHQRLARPDLGQAERASLELVSLPLHPGLSERDVARVSEALAASIG